jgi:hypothetical protein
MSDKEASQVLTSENAAEFYANRLGLAESPADTEAVEETPEPVAEEEQSEPKEAEKEANQEGERKQNPKLEKRFSEITKQREEARQEAQKEREARMALEQRLSALEQQKPEKVNVDQEPQPSQFNDAFEYAKALAEYSTEKALAERDRQVAQAKEQEAQHKIIESWAQKVQEAKAELPDFDDMVASSDVVVNNDVRDAILESDVGPKILYHLAENSDLAKRISGLSTNAALREIGKLEARFEAKPEVKQTPVVRSKAPTPIQPIRGGQGQADVPLSATGEWHGSFQAWKAARKAGKIR